MAQQLGQWTLGQSIGRGGQGHVFRATNEATPHKGKTFALKRLHHPGNEQASRRFFREVAALMRIDHEAVVKPVDVSERDDPNPFYVMPFEEGAKQLSDVIWGGNKESPYYKNPSLSLEFIAKCCQGLDAVHKKQVVHRDLKPDNILVRPDGTPLIIDFGCCLPVGDHGVVTMVDEGVGARNFMAPECEAGTEGEIGSRSDIYSLGKILWCMVTGERPFGREKPAFTNKAVTNYMPHDPHVGFVMDAILESVRTDSSQRASDAATFGRHCGASASRIRAGARHPSHVVRTCPACLSTNVKIANRQIDSPKLDVFVFIGNTANNPDLNAKLCLDCGTVTLIDLRASVEHSNRLLLAQA